jgi:hypothetical protein
MALAESRTTARPTLNDRHQFRSTSNRRMRSHRKDGQTGDYLKWCLKWCLKTGMGRQSSADSMAATAATAATAARVAVTEDEVCPRFHAQEDLSHDGKVMHVVGVNGHVADAAGHDLEFG